MGWIATSQVCFQLKGCASRCPTGGLCDGNWRLDLHHDPLPIERALGVQWCIASDVFFFSNHSAGQITNKTSGPVNAMLCV